MRCGCGAPGKLAGAMVRAAAWACLCVCACRCGSSLVHRRGHRHSHARRYAGHRRAAGATYGHTLGDQQSRDAWGPKLEGRQLLPRAVLQRAAGSRAPLTQRLQVSVRQWSVHARRLGDGGGAHTRAHARACTHVGAWHRMRMHGSAASLPPARRRLGVARAAARREPRRASCHVQTRAGCHVATRGRGRGVDRVDDRLDVGVCLAPRRREAQVAVVQRQRRRRDVGAKPGVLFN